MKDFVLDFAPSMKRMKDLYAQYQQDSSENISENEKFITAAEYDFDGNEIIQAVVVRGQELPQEEIAQYRQLQQSGGELGLYQMSQALIDRYKEQLLATPQEIAQFFPDGLPPLFFSLDAWHHPNLALGELPSQSETFQLIAKAICSGRVEDYRPAQEPNSSWRYWLG